jgi:translation initiation factor IF-1
VAKKEYRSKERDDIIALKGVVEEALPGTLFKVRCEETGAVVLATLAGRLRQNKIRVLPNDHVIVEVSPYDSSRGRVVWRE